MLSFVVQLQRPMWALVSDEGGRPKGEWTYAVRKVFALGCFTDNPESLEPLALASSVYRLSGDGEIENLFEDVEEADACALMWADGVANQVHLSNGVTVKGALAIRTEGKRLMKRGGK